MLKTIPLDVLIDTVTHSKLIQGTRGNTYTPSTILNNVLVQSKNIRTNVDGQWISTSGALMFWDNTHSTEITFAIGDRITYTDKAVGEVSRYIKEISPEQTNEGLHHIELILL